MMRDDLAVMSIQDSKIEGGVFLPVLNVVPMLEASKTLYGTKIMIGQSLAQTAINSVINQRPGKVMFIIDGLSVASKMKI